MSIHDVEMNVVCTGRFNSGDFFAQLGKVGSEKGGGDSSAVRHKVGISSFVTGQQAALRA